MARRKIKIQPNVGRKSSSQESSRSAIEELTGEMGTVDLGFKPTDQRIYKIDLNRIWPDPDQPRQVLPHDLREQLHAGTVSAQAVMTTLQERAAAGDTVAMLILGGQQEPTAAEESDPQTEDGLLALAESIRAVGLRQPINVYQVDVPGQQGQSSYRIGEGERRFWAHQLLVLQGHGAFRYIRCIIDTLPDDAEVIYQRQAAENAARQDLPAIARARAMLRIKKRLETEMTAQAEGARVSQREIQQAVGQAVKSFTGRAIGDRMVRNYLALLNLSATGQDLVEAGQLSEKQLRPVLRLKSAEERLALIRQIIGEQWSSRQVFQQVEAEADEKLPPVEKPKKTLREVTRTTVEERFEKRIIDAAKSLDSLLTLPTENYETVVQTLAVRASDAKTRQVLVALQQTLGEVLQKAERLAASTVMDVALFSILPPLESLAAYLPADKLDMLQRQALTGNQILERLFAWQEDVILDSRLHPFLSRLEQLAEAVRAGEEVEMPEVVRRQAKYETVAYQLRSGVELYWTHVFLVNRGEAEFGMLRVQLLNQRAAEER